VYRLVFPENNTVAFQLELGCNASLNRNGAWSKDTRKDYCQLWFSVHRLATDNLICLCLSQDNLVLSFTYTLPIKLWDVKVWKSAPCEMNPPLKSTSIQLKSTCTFHSIKIPDCSSIKINSLELMSPNYHIAHFDQTHNSPCPIDSFEENSSRAQQTYRVAMMQFTPCCVHAAFLSWIAYIP